LDEILDEFFDFGGLLKSFLFDINVLLLGTESKE
jgi:hypothetical protein